MASQIEVMFISSGGGHLAQLLALIDGLPPRNAILVTERSAKGQGVPAGLKAEFLPHGGRERLWLFLPLFVANILLSCCRVIKYRPQIVVTTGAHTAVPTCYLAKMAGAKIIFIETLAKVRSPTLTGRMVHPIADAFYVQWEPLLRFYPKARMAGRIY